MSVYNERDYREQRWHRERNSPPYESVAEARQELDDLGVSPVTINELFEAAQNAAVSLVAEYGVRDEVDTEVVARWLMISACESSVQFIENDVWEDPQEGVERLVADMDQSAATLVGGTETRNRDMAVLFNAMLAENHEQD
ncbi:hypothetical protein [Halobaculum sp. D14]|uniref:hypothetical protein n=1 Tax=Halobaculum sp. D14 TaxID=3421642 RepID=UPI003EBD8B9B